MADRPHSSRNLLGARPSERVQRAQPVIGSRSLASPRRWPPTILLVAALAGLLHIAPLWRAQSQTPAGWTFTGDLKSSPDVLQYRILTTRSQLVGPVVDNRLTSEPNAPHIPMLFYFGMGKVAFWLDVAMPFVLEYAGIPFAIILVLGLFRGIDHFLANRYQTWCVLLVLLVGGGLGAHLLLISNTEPLRSNLLVQRVVTGGLEAAPVFDQYRNHYLFTTLFDSHFLFFLLLALTAISGLYYALRVDSLGRVLIAALLFGLMAVFHLYDAVTLLFIAAGVVFLLWCKGHPSRAPLITLAACTLSVTAGLLWQIALYRASGIPIPDWRAKDIDASILLLAYPVAWGIIVSGLGTYWRSAGFKETFLLGWALGCTVLTLSGPFYPYSDRGTLTLQIPLYLIAGGIFFARHVRVRPLHALLAVALLGATPAYVLRNAWRNTAFPQHQEIGSLAHIWMSPEHLELKDALEQRAGAADVLLLDKSDMPWRTDDLWLAPEFPGKLFCGHYALTVDYERKRQQTNRVFASADSAIAIELLRRDGIRFVFVSAAQGPARFERIPGLAPILRNRVGALFEFAPPMPSAAP